MDLSEDRPFRCTTRHEMLAVAERELLNPADPQLGPRLELPTLAWHEFRERGRATASLDRLFADAEVAPLPWLIEARERFRKILRTKRGGHHVYAIRLDFDWAQGVYVGETCRTLEHRFTKHRTDRSQASGVVHRRGREVLQSLTAHLNPLTRAEAKQLEPVLFEALKGCVELRDDHIRGGH